MTNHSERLNARVRAFNRVNKRAIELHGELVEIFRPFVGKKVQTNSGWIAKLRPQLEAIREREGQAHTGGFQLYSNGNKYTASFTLKAWEPYSGEQMGGAYAEANIYVGDFGGRNITQPEALPCDHLERLHEEPPKLRTDYDAEQIRQLRKTAQEAADVARAAEYALSPFGKYDQ